MKWWRKQRRKEPPAPQIPMPFPYGVDPGMPPELLADAQMAAMAQRHAPKPPTKFVLPDWLDRIMVRVMARFTKEELPEGWKIQAFQTRDLYVYVLTGPPITVSEMGEPVSWTHELEFEKEAIRGASEEVAEWTIFKALSEIFALIEENGPFPPELKEMR